MTTRLVEIHPVLLWATIALGCGQTTTGPPARGEAAPGPTAKTSASAAAEKPAAPAAGADAKRTSDAARRSGGPSIQEAPTDGDVATLVQVAADDARSRGRRVVVYVGAPWCEPCNRFHAAVTNGTLDDIEPLKNVEFFEFNMDTDKDRLGAAGYASRYIPLFALPGLDGRASGKQLEGGIKGPKAVDFLVKRLAPYVAANPAPTPS